MKNAIVKAVVLCTLALSLLCMGVAAFSGVTTNTEVAGLYDGEYDGPYDCEYVY